MPEQDDSYVVDSFCVSDNYMTQKVAKKKVKKSFRRPNVDYNDSLMVELVEQTNHEIEISRKKGFSKAGKKSKMIESSSEEEKDDAKTRKFRRLKVLSESSDNNETTESSISKPFHISSFSNKLQTLRLYRPKIGYKHTLISFWKKSKGGNLLA